MAASTPTLLDNVKTALNITGTYQDATLQLYIDEVLAFLNDAGIKSADATVGLVARGVSDLWNYGAGGGKLSEYFYQRATQIAPGG